nr:MAG TPA: hypothetical protein [Caudoviricetes sp.]
MWFESTAALNFFITPPGKFSANFLWVENGDVAMTLEKNENLT